METFSVTEIEYVGNVSGDYLATELQITIDTSDCSSYCDVVGKIAYEIFRLMSFRVHMMEI
jgi:hypothetical protein